MAQKRSWWFEASMLVLVLIASVIHVAVTENAARTASAESQQTETQRPKRLASGP